jgi:hypothetical protein
MPVTPQIPEPEIIRENDHHIGPPAGSLDVRTEWTNPGRDPEKKKGKEGTLNHPFKKGLNTARCLPKSSVVDFHGFPKVRGVCHPPRKTVIRDRLPPTPLLD